MAGICGKTQHDGTVCTNAAGCKIPHPQSPVPSPDSEAVVHDGGYSTAGWRAPTDRELAVAVAVEALRDAAEECRNLVAFQAGADSADTLLDKSMTRTMCNRACRKWLRLTDGMIGGGAGWEDLPDLLPADPFDGEYFGPRTRDHLAGKIESRAKAAWTAHPPWEREDDDEHDDHAFSLTMLSLMVRGSAPRDACEGAVEAWEHIAEKVVPPLRDDWDNRDDPYYWADEDGRISSPSREDLEWRYSDGLDEALRTARDTARSLAGRP